MSDIMAIALLVGGIAVLWVVLQIAERAMRRGPRGFRRGIYDIFDD
jgi:hypothetical protein